MIADRVLKVVTRKFPDGEVRDGDSLEMMELVMDLEDEFGINIPQNKFELAKSTQDIIDLITEWADTAEDTSE